MRLRGTEVLCGGPIKSLFSADGFDDGMRTLVTRTVRVLEEAGAVVTNAHIAEAFSTVDLSSEAVTSRDHAWCESCDVYVALLPTDSAGTVCPSAGTAIELGWVSAAGKPVVIVWDADRSSAYSHLVRGLDAVTEVVFLDLLQVDTDPDRLVRAVAEARGSRPGTGNGGRVGAHGHTQ